MTPVLPPRVQNNVPLPDTLTGMRAKRVANDLMASHNLDRIKGRKNVASARTQPQDTSIASLAVWVESATKPEFERLSAKYIELQSVGGRTKMLVDDARKEVRQAREKTAALRPAGSAVLGALTPPASQTCAGLMWRGKKDPAYKVHEGLLRILQSAERDLVILQQRIDEAAPASMVLQPGQDGEDGIRKAPAKKPQPKAQATETEAPKAAPSSEGPTHKNPIAIPNPWPVGPRFVYAHSSSEFEQMRTLVGGYTNRLNHYRNEVIQNRVTELRAMHTQLDTLLHEGI